MSSFEAHKRISYSQISQFQKCPLSYYFRYIEKIPTKPSPHLSFGSSIHEALSQFYEKHDGQFPPFDLLESLLEKNWISEGYASIEEELFWKENALKALKNFYEREEISRKKPLEVEQWFEIPFEDFKLVGKIDRIDRTDNGRLHILDYKTGEKVQSEEQVKKDLQLAIYHYACRHEYQEEPEKVSLYFLSQDKIITVQLSDIEIRNAVNNIYETYERISEAIKRNHFPPNVGRFCGYCDFQENCPEIKPKTSEQILFPESSVFSESLISSQTNLRQLLERLTLIEEEIGALKAEKEKIEKQVIYEMEKAGKKKLEFEDYFVEMVEGVKYYADEDQLTRVLKKYSLFEGVVNINIRALIKTLKNESVPETVKQEVQSHIYVDEVKKKLRMIRINEE